MRPFNGDHGRDRDSGRDSDRDGSHGLDRGRDASCGRDAFSSLLKKKKKKKTTMIPHQTIPYPQSSLSPPECVLLELSGRVSVKAMNR